MDLTETVCGSLGTGGNQAQGGKFVGTRLRRFLLPAAPEPAREHGHAGGKLPRLVPTLFARSCEDGREA